MPSVTKIGIRFTPLTFRTLTSKGVLPTRFARPNNIFEGFNILFHHKAKNTQKGELPVFMGYSQYPGRYSKR